MAKQSLVVVESAAKAKTIEKFLGRDFMVRACLGHVRDLPTSKLGVDVEHDFHPQYVVTKDRKDVVKRLKDDARGKTSVLLATDPDREGEAIAWHLLSAMGLDGDQPVSRIEFHEVTKGAVLAALNNPRGIDMDRVDAEPASPPAISLAARFVAACPRVASSRWPCASSSTVNAKSWPLCRSSTGRSRP